MYQPCRETCGGISIGGGGGGGGGGYPIIGGKAREAAAAATPGVGISCCSN